MSVKLNTRYLQGFVEDADIKAIAPEVTAPTAVPTPAPINADVADDCSRVARNAFSFNVVMSTPNQF